MKCTVALPLRRAQGCREHAHIWQADGIRTNRPVAARTAPACTPDDRTRLRSTAPARPTRYSPPARTRRRPMEYQLFSAGHLYCMAYASSTRRVHARTLEQRLILASAFHSARPPSIRHSPAYHPSRAHAPNLSDRKSLPPTTSTRHQPVATFALAFTFTSSPSHSPHAPPFLERPKPEARARLRTGVPAGRTRTLYSIPR